MSTIEALKQAGLDVQFDAFMDDYFLDEAKKDQLRTMVDERGLVDPVVMKMIGTMQREDALKPGIYREFKLLAAELSGADSAPTTASAETATQPQTVVSGGNGEAKVVSEEETDEAIEAKIDAYSFSDAQEEMIKQRLAAEEEKIRNRLLAKERKIREEIVTGRVRKQKRTGLPPEQAKIYNEAKQAMQINTAKIKQLREENKQHRAVIDSLRPKRNVRQRSHEEKQVLVAKRKLTMALKGTDQGIIDAAKLALQQAEETFVASQAAPA